MDVPYIRGQELPHMAQCKESACQCRRCEFHPGWGRSTGGGNGNPLQYSRLRNPMDRRSLAGYRPQVAKRVGYDFATKHQQHKSFTLFKYKILKVGI